MKRRRNKTFKQYPELAYDFGAPGGRDDDRTRYLMGCAYAVEQAQAEVRRRMHLLGLAVRTTAKPGWLDSLGIDAVQENEMAQRRRAEADGLEDGKERRECRAGATQWRNMAERDAATYEWLTGRRPAEAVLAREAETFLAGQS